MIEPFPFLALVRLAFRRKYQFSLYEVPSPVAVDNRAANPILVKAIPGLRYNSGVLGYLWFYVRRNPLMRLYPFRFEPAFRRYLWGGRKLQEVLGKNLPPGNDYAESWEVVDHGVDQSRVAYGPLAGTTLHELVERHEPDLLGSHDSPDRFPLLFKFLDARSDLSIQVHPNDTQAAQLPRPDLGKTEAWVVLAAEHGSKLYAGLREGIDREAFARHLATGTTLQAMHVVHPRVGDCVFIPAGVVHAIGAGLLIAEIQQASDTTFRLFDWNRVDAEGKPRALHVREGLDVCDFRHGPVTPQVPIVGSHPDEELLVDCDKFVLRRRSIHSVCELDTAGRFLVLAVLDGRVDVAGDPAARPLRRGETILIPACCHGIRVVPQVPSTMLVISPPSGSGRVSATR